MSDHLRRANDELDGVEHRPSREEIAPPTDAEVEASIRWLEERKKPRVRRFTCPRCGWRGYSNEGETEGGTPVVHCGGCDHDVSLALLR
jgi:hypothetical protein